MTIQASKFSRLLIRTALAAALLLTGGIYDLSQSTSLAQMKDNGPGSRHRHGHGHGADGTGHDEVNMPGLRGQNATPEESAELAVLFRNFETITREVTELPNGIRTVTRSSRRGRDDQPRQPCGRNDWPG